MAAYLQTAFRAIAFANQFFSLRAEYQGLIKNVAGSKDARGSILRLIDGMERIVKSDLVNARRGLAIARRDPRLDLAVRLDLDYPPLDKIIEAKIRYTEDTILKQLGAARRSF
jgi:hypothetical protein